MSLSFSAPYQYRGGEVELCPKHEIQIDSFMGCRDLAEQIHSAEVPHFRHRHELLDYVLFL